MGREKPVRPVRANHRPRDKGETLQLGYAARRFLIPLGGEEYMGRCYTPHAWFHLAQRKGCGWGEAIVTVLGQTRKLTPAMRLNWLGRLCACADANADHRETGHFAALNFSTNCSKSS